MSIALFYAAGTLCAWLARRRPSWLVPAAAAFLALPLLVPSLELRFGLAVAGLIAVAKALALSLGRTADGEMQRTFPRFVLWQLLPAESRWPRDQAEQRRARHHGLRRVLRGLAELALVTALAALLPLGFIAQHRGLDDLWTGVFSGLTVPGLVDLLTGLVMLSGLPVAEVFRLPLLADSPLDFWGRRWNLFYADWARRVLILPLRRPVLSAALIFLLTAAVHEELVLVTLGRTRFEMTAFFALQAGALLAQRLLRRRLRLPRLAAFALHSLWLWLTLPLFFAPMRQIFALHLERLQ